MVLWMLGQNSSFVVNDTGTLRLRERSSEARRSSASAGVTATIVSGFTLELTGTTRSLRFDG